jgi:hypothetical protein
MKTKAQDGDFGSRHTNLGNSSPSNGELSSAVESEEASGDAVTTGISHDRSSKLDKSFGSLHICESGTLYTGNGFWATLHGEVIPLCATELDKHVPLILWLAKECPRSL